MALDTCKITVPGRHVKAGLPNTAKQPNRGSQGNTTRPWHSNTRTIRGFMVGMSAYGKPISDHIANCGECAAEYVELIDTGKHKRFSNFDRKGSIQKTLFLSGRLPRPSIPKAFIDLGFDGLQWLVKNGAKTEDVIKTAILGIEERKLKLTLGQLIRTPWRSRVPGPFAGTYLETPNFSWETKEMLNKVNLLVDPDSKVMVDPKIKIATPDEKARLIAQHVWALHHIGSEIPLNFRDLHRDGKGARALIDVSRA